MSETPHTGYEKPEFPFYQQVFDGSQPEVSSGERQLAGSTFATTVDQVLDRAPDVEHLGEERWEGGDTSDSADIPTPDGRRASVNVRKTVGGRVVARWVTLHWDDEGVGTTEYFASYRTDEAVVRRTDDTGRAAPGLDVAEAHRSKVEAERLQEENRFNNQPIGTREADGLRGYLLPKA